MNFTVAMTLQVAGDFTVNNNSTLNSNGHSVTISAGDDISLGNSFVGSINFIAADDIRINNGATITGNLSAGDDIDIDNNASISGNLTAGDDISIGSNGTVNGNVSAADDLNVDSSSTINGTCSYSWTNYTCNPRSLTINNVSVAEGDSGTVSATFTVTLSSTSSTAVTFNYATSNGTATGGAACTSGVDFIALSGSKTISAGLLSTTITVQVCGDTVDESDETFSVVLSSPSGATLGSPSTGMGTITDDEITLATCGSGTISGIVNTYYPGTASVSAGATSISVGTASGSSTALAQNDLILIMQMQDASITTSNDSSYGTASAVNAGKYEYATVASVGSGTITLSSPLVNSYSTAAYGASGQKTFQVIRVPVYSSATLGSATAKAWDGSTGGILAIDVTGTLTLGGATVSVDGLGFRGGATRMLSGGGGTDTDYRSLATVNTNASKGESIAGTPRYVFTSPGTVTNTGVEGYPNGSHARGAPANGGGGGSDGNPAANDQNTGGGGGGSKGAGGMGGIAWCPTFNASSPPNYNCDPYGGLGGKAVAELAAGQLTLGGGGGGATSNNGTGSGSCDTTNGGCSSGAAGGGIIMIRAASFSGSATFNANGSNANNTVENDGSGGGGGGGAVLLFANAHAGGTVTINAKGGNGGTNLIPPASSGPHGPGGGGGGGYALRSSVIGANCTVSGGTAGATYNNGTLFGAYGATDGSAGACTTTLSSSQMPGSTLGSGPCVATLNHYSIAHSGNGLTCEAEPITFTAHDNAHARVVAAGKSLGISTDSASGAWLATADSCSQTCYDSAGSSVSCTGIFTPTTGNNGQATYVFGSGESGVRLCYKQNSNTTVNINVTDGSATETTGAATSGDDPSIVFSNTGFRFYANGAVDTLPNLVAGLRSDTVEAALQPSPQTITIRALKSSETTPARCVSLLGSGSKTIQFAYQCIDPNACHTSSNGLEVNGTTVAGSGSVPTPGSNVSVSFDGAGTGTLNLKYWDVGQIKLYAQSSIADATTGGTASITTGASNTFTVKPYGFSVIACTGSTPCATANASPADGSGTVFAKAGDTFNATVKAVAYGGSVITPSFGAGTGSGTETVSLTHALVAPTNMCAGPSNCSGSLGGTTTLARSAFTNGVHSVTNLTWSEVGVMTLTAANGTYMALASGASGVSGNIGRFSPHHFGVTGTVTNRSDLSTPGGSFTYMGEPMRMTLAVTAYNNGEVATQNYAGSFAKLDAATLGTGANWFNVGCAAGTQCMGLGVVSGSNLTSRLAIDTTSTNSTTPSNSPWSGGTSTFTLYARFDRSTAPDGPYATLKFGAKPLDSDGISIPLRNATDMAHCVNLNITSGTENALCDPGTTESNLRRKLFETAVRYGRLRIANAFGSEHLALPMTALMEYYSGGRWITNTDDSLTTLSVLGGPSAAISLVPSGSTTPRCNVSGSTCTASSGVACNASTPIANGNLGLCLTKPNVTGQADISFAPPGYLQISGVTNPKGRAGFGVYNLTGNSQRIIHRQEVR